MDKVSIIEELIDRKRYLKTALKNIALSDIPDRRKHPAWKQTRGRIMEIDHIIKFIRKQK